MSESAITSIERVSGLTMRKADPNFELIPKSQRERVLQAWDELDRDDGFLTYDKATELSRLAARLEVVEERHKKANANRPNLLSSSRSRLQSFFSGLPVPKTALAFSFLLGASTVGLVLELLDMEGQGARETKQIAVSELSISNYRGAVPPDSAAHVLEKSLSGEKTTNERITVNGSSLNLGRSPPPWVQIADLLDDAGLEFSLTRNRGKTSIFFNLQSSDEKTRVIRALLALPPNYIGAVRVEFETL